MNYLDAYYRALTDYRKSTLANRECSSLRQAIAASNAERDKITIKRAICTVDEDWVLAIEQGLVHVEKAIKEERQFIRSNGEVVSIEKVKHVSKETVEHLAKHSNLITRFEEDEDIVPDKLFAVERLSDYAVYENRFLFMLLSFLRDFVTIRYNKILDLTNKYDATVDMTKEIATGKQKVKYTISMRDERRDDPYLKEHNLAKDTIDRIDLIHKTILSFLATPLMESVSKVAMIKPPITKTNVLKMNNNFKGAVALYDFIIAYDKPGYNIETKTITLAPFREDLADEMAETGALVSFLAYEYGLGIKQDLKESYLREEERRKAEEIKQRAEKIKALERKLRANESTLEEYVLTLEKQLKDLQTESERAESLSQTLITLRGVEKEKNEKIASLLKEIEALNEKIEELKREHFAETEALKEAHSEELHRLVLRHEENVNEINRLHEDAIEQLNRSHEEKTSALKEEMASMQSELEEKLESLRLDCEERRKEAEALQKEKNTLMEEKTLLEARIKALGGEVEDFTSREKFGQLEKEYLAFKSLYKAEWKKAKQKIRKDILDIQKLKGQKEQDKRSD